MKPNPRRDARRLSRWLRPLGALRALTVDDPRRRARRSRLLALAVAVIGLEVALRVLPVPAFAPQSIAYDLDDTRYVAHPYLAYAPRPDWTFTDPETGQVWTHNSLGFRGPEFSRVKPPNTYRIITLGGSSTYGHTESDDGSTWPARLQAHLGAAISDRNVEVINAGVSGRNSFEMVIDLAVRLIDLEPDLVLYYESINDVRLWSWPDWKPDNTHARAVWPVLQRSLLDSMLESSRIYLVGRRYLTDYWESMDLGHWVVNGYGEKERMRNEFHPEGPVAFARNLKDMALLCRGHGVRIAFATQACFQDDLRLWSDKQGMSRARKEILDVGKELGVPVLDIATRMPKERRLFANDVHCTDEGADLLARYWTEFLVESGPLGP